VYWGIALTLLLAAGLFSWLVVVPVWRTHSVLAETEPLRAIGKAINNSRHFSPDRQPIDIMQPNGQPLTLRTVIMRLGGPQAAERKLKLYLQVPRPVAEMIWDDARLTHRWARTLLRECEKIRVGGERG